MEPKKLLVALVRGQSEIPYRFSATNEEVKQ
jgi:hypothetical protein